MPVGNVRVTRRDERPANQAANDNQRPRSERVVRFPSRTQNVRRNPSHSTTDEQFTATYQQAGVLNRSEARQEIDRAERQYANQTAVAAQTSSIPVVQRKSKVKHKPKKTEIMTARLKLSAINGWVFAWVGFWYIAVQLPFALLSTTGLGISYAVYSYASQIQEDSVIGGFFIETIAELSTQVFGSISEAIAAITDFLFGIAINPMFLFTIPFAIVLTLGILQLLITWLIYALAGIKSLSGQRGGIKQTLAALAVVSIAIPILNLIPFILLWMIVVWKYPK